MSHDKKAVFLARWEEGESMRGIARKLDLSLGAVHAAIANESVMDGLHA